jgi:arabinose-5-phosphate isomerase
MDWIGQERFKRGILCLCDKRYEVNVINIQTAELVTENNEGCIKILATRLLQDLQANVDVLFQRFDCPRFSKIIEIVLHSKGCIFFTGVGKSGIIAKKIAMTFSSSGTKALYLSPQNALHGDIGMVGRDDIVFLMSKSGESTELLELCPALRNKGAHLVAVVTNEASRLARACDASFVLPELKELCPFDLAPTTSTIAQLVFGDVLAMALMRLKGVSLSDFIQNHPAGRIGRRQLVKVRDLMVSGDAMPLCAPSDTLGSMLVELSNKQCGCVCIVDGESRLLGIFTDGDLRRTLQKLGPAALGATMGSLMTGTPRTISQGMLAYEAMRVMEADQKHPVTVLPVVEEGRCVGLIKMHDIIQSGI